MNAPFPDPIPDVEFDENERRGRKITTLILSAVIIGLFLWMGPSGDASQDTMPRVMRKVVPHVVFPLSSQSKTPHYNSSIVRLYLFETQWLIGAEQQESKLGPHEQLIN